ncbi:hypothetical protein X760_04445 [Mesorhizobium sp. LSHC422A00]|uniref:hypothetical protein n=1 Tax=Mesorhizobium sp. LSHC422A00 TaxID=1287294 RepID=UPI0003CE30B9|nr:hypothetical protein [Mesorhizobium sp. LSHC422A00]ESX62627.1 hypothetical protein X760_04445 [Mesorhizobium sp. LSHC422A00]
MHLSRSLLLAAIAVAALVKFASAQTVTVSIAVTTNSTPPVGVPAHIYRKSASTDEKLVTDTDGKAMVSEVICSADVQYRAEALALIRFPRGAGSLAD